MSFLSSIKSRFPNISVTLKRKAGRLLVNKLFSLVTGNPCKENQFSCLDGSCVSLSVTFDGVWNCQDGSDEPHIAVSITVALCCRLVPMDGFLFDIVCHL